jgi:hypothetical protein
MNTNPYSSPSSPLHPDPQAINDGGEVAGALVATLAATKPWLRVVGVFMWIGVGFMLLLAMFMAAFDSFGAGGLNDSNPQLASVMRVGLPIFYLVFGALYIYPARRIWSCGSAIDRLTRSRNLADLKVVLETQRSFWKFVGVSFLLFTGLYALLLVGIMAVAMMKGSGAAP